MDTIYHEQHLLAYCGAGNPYISASTLVKTPSMPSGKPPPRTGTRIPEDRVEPAQSTSIRKRVTKQRSTSSAVLENQDDFFDPSPVSTPAKRHQDTLGPLNNPHQDDQSYRSYQSRNDASLGHGRGIRVFRLLPALNDQLSQERLFFRWPFLIRHP
ncbi:hypothetical protein D9758_017343 [Tetrapyrgos nigripes]|uniref:Uncharacterized protein n=1 Tax=Tetrapyrgos nigripes TaxID=182062 RepID=A0A8H5CAI2_9AGAR|nr:hypothetical protein D9758_017343 [Tetrapyrgos nigripes]